MSQLTLNLPAHNISRQPKHAGKSGYEHYRREFITLFRDTARYHNRYEVFRDFAEMGALAVQNVFLRSEALEDEYLNLARRYKKDDLLNMSRLLGCMAAALDCQPGDFLGQIFSELEIASAEMGQFFTPYYLSSLMARLTTDELFGQLDRAPFITFHEPAVGAGSMVIAFAEAMFEKGLNPQKQLFVSCNDISPVAVHMCYLQLSYLGIPAEVSIANTLTLKTQRTYRTPLWYLGGWRDRLELWSTLNNMRALLGD
jgi:hypothetical protein